jgi:hypothetical protein
MNRSNRAYSFFTEVNAKGEPAGFTMTYGDDKRSEGKRFKVTL